MIGRIHSFQSLGTLDGPGVRFITFMHGCNLSCGYCHNIDVCKGNYQEFTADDVLKRALRCKEYFGKDGGITVSGGEPLMQAEFVYELFKKCHENAVHTVLDTSGSIWNDATEKLLTVTDMVLLDIKMVTDELYKKYIGCGIDAPLKFLDELEKRKIPVVIRQVIVSGINDTEESILKLKELTKGKSCVVKTELLPFRKICSEKYKEMGIAFPFEHYDEPDEKTMNRLNNILEKNNETYI